MERNSEWEIKKLLHKGEPRCRGESEMAKKEMGQMTHIICNAVMECTEVKIVEKYTSCG